MSETSKILKKRLRARFDKNAKDAKLREFVLRTSMAMPIESIIGINAVQAPIEPGYERIISCYEWPFYSHKLTVTLSRINDIFSICIELELQLSGQALNDVGKSKRIFLALHKETKIINKSSSTDLSRSRI